MALRFSTGLRTAIAGTLGAGGALANGVMDIYTGSQPVGGDSPATGTLLATVTLNGGAFTSGTPTNGLTFLAAVAGELKKSGVWGFTGLAAGTTGWFRFRGNAADNGLISTTLIRLDGSVGSSGTDLLVPNMVIAVGSYNTINEFTLAFPAT